MKPSFSDFLLNKSLLTAIEENGFTEPTPIQEAAIKPILAGRQVVGIAQTGTGKTAAFGIPIIAKLNFAQGEHPRALILSPTRELAMQTASHLILLAQKSDLRIMALFGGVGSKEQKLTIAAGVDIMVATPGRLLELYEEGILIFRSITIFVIDEADKMMDMGFIRAIHRILEVLPRKKQCLLFSATMNGHVEKLYGDFMEFPLVVETSRQATPAEKISQNLYVVPGIKSKINLLLYLLEHEMRDERVIVFCKTKSAANQINSFLDRKMAPGTVGVIHGNKDQNSRIQAMKDLRDGKISCLVATDVASRGIDIPEIRFVVNFDVPLIPGDYVHRIGRTGRAGLEGQAFTFCSPHENYYLKKIELLIRQKIKIILVPAGIIMEEPEFEEKQAQEKEIDGQRKKEDPDYQGAFHEKKSLKLKANKSRNGKKEDKKRGYKKS